MKKKSIFLLAVVLSIFVYGCKDYRDVSIFETIPEKELIKKGEKGIDFVKFYDTMNKNRDELNKMSTADKTRFYKITYLDLYKSREYFSKITEKEIEPYKEKWRAKYLKDEIEFDSIVDFHNHLFDGAEGNARRTLAKHRYANGEEWVSDDELLKRIVPDYFYYYLKISIGKERSIRRMVNPDYRSELEYIRREKFPLQDEFAIFIEQRN